MIFPRESGEEARIARSWPETHRYGWVLFLNQLVGSYNQFVGIEEFVKVGGLQGVEEFEEVELFKVASVVKPRPGGKRPIARGIFSPALAGFVTPQESARRCPSSDILKSF